MGGLGPPFLHLDGGGYASGPQARLQTSCSRPRGSGPAQLIRAVLVEEFYLAVKELEQRGTPLSGLLADQLDADPLGTLTKLKAYLLVK